MKRKYMERLEIGWTVTRIHLDVSMKIPGADAAAFDASANAAKAGCPSHASVEHNNHHGR